MAELTIVDGPGTGATIALSADQAYSIGSSAEDSIHVPGDGIAARHVIVKALKTGGFGAKGLVGPFEHNGAEVSVARLTEGDRIALGECVLRFGEVEPAPEPKPAAEPARSPANEPPQLELPGFKILAVLGKGGMGTVYRAEQVSLGREVALKVLSHELTSDATFVEQFVAEARAAARLHHPNVVQVFDVGNHGDTYFYSMELMHGGSLEERLREQGQIPVEEAVAMVKDAARGLGFAESLSIVHRDIKPDNLMIDHHGHVKIADLGLALTDSNDSKKLLGTPHFMSPEQIQRAPLDHRSDLYSLGCTLFRLVTGRAPFKRSTVKEILRAHVRDEPELAHKLNPAVPAELSNVIARLLEKSPDDRYQQARELVEGLESLESPPSRKGLAIAAVAVFAIIATGAVWWAATRPEKTEIIHQPTRPDDDEGDSQTAKENRELAASSAYFQVQALGLDGDAKAEKLEAMVAEHPGTTYAEQARTEASELRAAAARARQAEANTRDRVAAAAQTLRTSVDGALASFDFAAAESALSLDTIDADLRSHESITSLRDELRTAVETAARIRMDAFKAEVNAAVNARDADRIDRALAPIQAAMNGDAAWPASALGDPAVLERYVADTRVTVDAIRRESVAAQADAAWIEATTKFFADDGLTSAIRSFDFATAAERGHAISAALSDSPAGQHVAQLTAAVRAAESFLTSYLTALRSGPIPVPTYAPDAAVTGFERTGSRAGISIRTGGQTETLSLDDAVTHLDALFVLPDAPPDHQNRSAFLALQFLARRTDAIREFLQDVKVDDDNSGTGSMLEPIGVVASIVEGRLARCTADWAAPLRLELDAIARVSRAINAFSTRRNSAAAKLIDSALASGANTLVIRGLR